MIKVKGDKFLKIKENGNKWQIFMDGGSIYMEFVKFEFGHEIPATSSLLSLELYSFPYYAYVSLIDGVEYRWNHVSGIIEGGKLWSM